MKHLVISGCLLLGLWMLISCRSDPPSNRKATSPVTGQITVDGKPPDTPVKIICHDLAGINKQDPTFSWCLTGDEGTFELNTYEQGDGVPPGKYVLTFEWREWNPISVSYGGKDRLNGRYSEPAESEIQFEVDGATSANLGTIPLTTK
jgi:hypothetical protein